MPNRTFSANVLADPPIDVLLNQETKQETNGSVVASVGTRRMSTQTTPRGGVDVGGRGCVHVQTFCDPAIQAGTVLQARSACFEHCAVIFDVNTIRSAPASNGAVTISPFLLTKQHNGSTWLRRSSPVSECLCVSLLLKNPRRVVY